MFIKGFHNDVALAFGGMTKVLEVHKFSTCKNNELMVLLTLE